MNLTPEEEAIIKTAKLRLRNGKKAFVPLCIWGITICGFAVFFAHKLYIRTANLEGISEGFLFGLTLCILTTSFGFLGALCIGKSLSGFDKDFKDYELLIKLHEQLQRSA